jgi:hypothetical protein
MPFACPFACLFHHTNGCLSQLNHWSDFCGALQTDTLKAQDRAWMHADSAAKAQMLSGYLAQPESSTPNPKSEKTPKPPDFD